MKLNLLPTTEKKSRQGKTAFVLGALIVLCSIGVAVGITGFWAAKLNTAKNGIPELKEQVAKATATSAQADEVIKRAEDVTRNSMLARAMLDHNDVYPKLYDDLKPYIPPYYRIQSMSAVPMGENLSQVTLVGTLSGYQRYADLMLALMRFKDSLTIARQGYNLNDPLVPPLDPSDQQGKMRRADQGPIPDDQLERLAYFQQQASSAPSGYLATGNFGGGTEDVRGALPDASIVTIVMTVKRDLRVPLAADTLRAAGGGAAGVGGPAGPGGPGMTPGMPGGAPPMGRQTD